MHDLVVVGSGPAGATLARLTAAAGMSVVLLEAAALPRYKPCGGGLTCRALRLLPAEALASVRLRCPGAVAAWGRCRVRVHAQSHPVAMVMRSEFDARLAELAAEAGATVLPQTPVAAARRLAGGGVEVASGGRTWRARYLAWADGATGPSAGPVGQALGLLPPARRIGALEVELEDPDRAWGDLLRGDFDVVPGGYGWVFPKDGMLSIGVASWRPAIGGAALRAALADYLVRLGLRGRFEAARPRVHGHPIPVGGRTPAAALAAGPVLRLGDAAGLADPLFGEGISHAIESAHAAADALRSGEPAAYAPAIASGMGPAFRLAAAIAAAFYAAPAPWCYAVASVPAAADALFGLAVGAGREGT